MSQQKDRRKSYLVDRDFQGSYANYVFKSCLLFVISGFVLFSGVAGLNYWFIQKMGMSSQMQTIFWTTVGINFALLLGVFIVYALLSFGLAILMSHRIAGPAFAYERRLRRMSFGDFKDPFMSRKKDQLKELEDSLNRFRLMVWKKVEEVENQRESYIRKVSSLEDDAQKFRLQHLIKNPVVETLEKHTSRRYTG